MKKIFLAVCALCLALGAKAQKVVEDDVNRTATTNVNTNHGTNSEVSHMNSGINFEYYAVDGASGIGMDYIFNYLMITGSYRFGSSNGVDSNAWSVGVGGHYRYWFGNRIYLEGNVGVEYAHGSNEYTVEDGTTTHTMFEGTKHEQTYTTTNYKKEKESNGDFALFVAPRVGIRLFQLMGSDISITAGYRWEFAKFKFSKDYTTDFFTVGIAGVF